MRRVFRKGLLVLALFTMAAQAGVAEEELHFRVWIDVTGKHKTEAAFLGCYNGKVHLKKPDNQEPIEVSLERLSQADQQYVRRLLQGRAARPSRRGRPGGNVFEEHEQRSNSMANLSRIAEAMQAYWKAHGKLPAAALRNDDGRQLLSWRVQLLPFLGEHALYGQFHLDEAWDGPHNKILFRRMPEVFRCPWRQNDGNTVVVVLTGEGRPFARAEGPSLETIVGDASGKIMCVEANIEKALPWTKPEDLVFDPNDVWRGLGDVYQGGFHAAFFDRSVHFLSKRMDPNVFRSLIPDATPGSGSDAIHPSDGASTEPGPSGNSRTNGRPLDEGKRPPDSVTEDWAEMAKLTAADGGHGDEYGCSAAISGRTVVVGAFLHDGKGVDSGAAYVYRKTGARWPQVAKLAGADSEAGDRFGKSVAIHEDIILVGAPSPAGRGFSNTDTGAAYVFADSDAGWQQVARLVGSDSAAGDDFGCSVALWGDTAAVGALGHDSAASRCGAVYVFRRTEGGWKEVAKLTARDAARGSLFGEALAMEDGTLIVGACSHSAVIDRGGPIHPSVHQSGAAYLFREIAGTWRQMTRLTASDAARTDFFGGSVAVSGETALVGAPYNDDRGDISGAAYFFGGEQLGWSELAKLAPSDAARSSELGFSSAMSGKWAIVGALGNNRPDKPGEAYVFRNPDLASDVSFNDQDSLLLARISASDGHVDNWFGHSVAISGELVVVGASRDRGTGSAYVFDLVHRGAGAEDESGEPAGTQPASARKDVMDGLVAWYPFDGDAEDRSGNGRHGSVYGATPVADRFGKPGAALGFDGRDDMVEIRHRATPEPPQFTISLWVRTTSAKDAAIINTNPDALWSTTHGYNCHTNADGAVGFSVDTRGTQNSVWTFSERLVCDGAWHHVAFVYDSSSSLQIYVDGLRQEATSNGPYAKTGAPIRIGMCRGAPALNFSGELDELRIYDRALASQEIEQLRGNPR